MSYSCKGECLMFIGNQSQVDIKRAYNEYVALLDKYTQPKGRRTTFCKKLAEDDLVKYNTLMNILTSVLPNDDMCTIPPLPEMYILRQEWVESYVVVYPTKKKIPIKVPEEWDMFKTREFIDTYVKYITTIIKIKDTSSIISTALNEVLSNINDYKTAQIWRSAFRMYLESTMCICNTYEPYMTPEQKAKWTKIQKKYTEPTEEKQFISISSTTTIIIVHSIDKNIDIELPDDCLCYIERSNEDCIIEMQSQPQFIMPDTSE